MQAVENSLSREMDREKKYSVISSLDTDLINEGYPFIEVSDNASYLYESNCIKDFIFDNFDELSIEILKCKNEGYSCFEISKKLGVSKKVIYNRLNKIKNILKNGTYH